MAEPSAPLRARLAADLTVAMKKRDRVRVDVLRTTLAAIANAEAVPSDAPPDIEGTGVAEVDRRELDDATVAGIVRNELDELHRETELRRSHGVDVTDLEARVDALTPYVG